MEIQKMKIHRSLKEWQAYRNTLQPELSIGFVPTMGALHRGHQTLLEQARRENKLVVLSIYINPTQFDDPKDLQNYPKALEKDLKVAEDAKVDHVILPSFEEMYADNYRFRISEKQFSRELCGSHRPGHFDGVLTVVMKLLNLVRPTKAYFGEKDFQQLQLVKDMAAAFFLSAEIVACATIRETDGVAMSSRNSKLDTSGREKAKLFATVLKTASDLDQARITLEKSGIKVDYLERHFGRRFGAVRVNSPLGEVRLIDNVAE